MKKGSLIAISGSDGAGKETQTKRLVERAKSEFYPVKTLSFPQYEKPTGKLVSAYLRGEFGNLNEVDPEFAASIYAVDRLSERGTLDSWIESEQNIILDRYIQDNIAHQSCKFESLEREKMIDWIKNLEYKHFNLPKPKLNLYLYLPLEHSQKAMEDEGREKDLHEKNWDYLKRVEETFLYLTETEPNFKLVSCLDNEKRISIEDMTEILWKEIKPHLVK
ncbi:MAG: deoxynucleoside kinase [Candidatus Nanoarchaeia archaeon]|nr:deoxynucleoside kinase [Candidatus Nanoarchaeia archaeon]